MTPKRLRLLFGFGAACLLCSLLIQAVLDLPAEASGLTHEVHAALGASGVEHPVTAVLLNFRGYDTWLELGVLLLAAIGVLLFQSRTDLTRVRVPPGADPVLKRALALLLPLAVLVSGYLLWVGKYSSGGAFQAGVVLGAALILMWLSGTRALVILPGHLFRCTLVIGFASFGVTAAVTSLGEYALLEYPATHAGDIILLIETCATLAIAWTMATLILGLQPERSDLS